MILRPRQVKAINDLRAAYRSGYRAPILVAPTGFGKTATSVEMIRSALARGRSVWFLAHLREILHATSQLLEREGIRHAWVAAGQLGDRRQAVQLAMVQTLVRRLDRYEPPDLLIVDEAHLAVAQTYTKILEWAPRAHRLFLTATPTRLDGRGLGEIADCIVPTCSTGDLIAEGLLAPIRYFAPDLPDLSNVRTTAGEYNTSDLLEAMDRPKLIGSVVEHYRKLASGKPCIAFCVSIAHAQHVAEQFNAAGFRAMAVDGATDDAMRDAALRSLQTGQLDVVANCALWVAGVDAPAVSCIALLAPTKSVTKYLQSVGRGLRTHPEKSELVILDHAGLVARFGMPTDERDWTLNGAGRRVRKPGETEEVKIKTCPKCYSTVAAVTTHCYCGHEFVAEGRVLEHEEGLLTEVDPVAARRSARVQQGQAQSLEELITIGRARGMKRPELWAKYVLRARHAKQAQKTGAINQGVAHA